jgi:cytochrome c biogenesis factor
MPISLWSVCGFKSKIWYLPHVGVLLLIIGAITSSAFSEERFTNAALVNNNVIILGTKIPISEIIEKEEIIISKPFTDAVIHTSDIMPVPQGGLVIPYTNKPLILLFWIGCYTIVLQPVIEIIIYRYKLIKSENSKKA